jgi:hypothetical protein
MLFWGGRLAMKSLTIHKLEEPLLVLLKEKAHKEGKSMNQTVKELIETMVGIKVKRRDSSDSEFKDLCGAWSSKDLQEFEQATRSFKKVDKEDWQ